MLQLVEIEAAYGDVGMAVRLGAAVARQGGVAGYVQERRLVRAFAMLSNPSNTSTISTTAYRCGFSSDAYFSRAFKQRFGCSPSELRADALSGARAHRLGERNQAMADNVFKAWVSGLSG